jgi:predicted AAA+ superfamily ATPase
LTAYGHLVETFAVGEILRQVTWSEGPVAVGHFRTSKAHEVDLVLERDDGMIFAFEIKAGTRVDRSDLAGTRAMRARLGERLATAVVFYTGALAFRFDDGTLVCPLGGTLVEDIVTRTKRHPGRPARPSYVGSGGRPQVSSVGRRGLEPRT